MNRRTLTDAPWAWIEALLPGKKGDWGWSGTDNRLFVDAILWPARAATPSQDLPPERGNWQTTHSRFRCWTIAGVWESLFKALSAVTDFEYVLVDATISQAHADASGQKGGAEAHAIGCSEGGLTTKSTLRSMPLVFRSALSSRPATVVVARRRVA